MASDAGTEPPSCGRGSAASAAWSISYGPDLPPDPPRTKESDSLATVLASSWKMPLRATCPRRGSHV